MKSISSFERLINSLKWKREGIIDKLRFESPYEYPWNDDEKGLHLMIYQSKSIAKTVWDSSIVLSKYFQKEFNQGKAIGLKALEIGCGCGLPGIVLALLGSNVVLTDLEGKKNFNFIQLSSPLSIHLFSLSLSSHTLSPSLLFLF
eukprot:TRINITY_DN1261_c0_g1_i4.p1 TRINITY_DN1261_c0_g1~~TRINITY_DN1261_c0_g1_i4.p1  ORF type:complete len:145 (-),score=49.52 TRINITY_DN1261_c0_g1_i4:739-1173(-)